MNTSKTHISLNVRDIDASVDFYARLFQTGPVKQKPGYAKFDLEVPALNLALNQGTADTGRGALSHLGIQVGSTEEVHDAIRRFRADHLDILEEHGSDCCYALQDKVWVSDPDGNRWEIFTIHVADTAPELNASAGPVAGAALPEPARQACGCDCG